MRHIRQAFTLIELLTVISIIIVLVLLVSGITAKARSRSNKMQCMHNLKELHTYTMIYHQEHDRLPMLNGVNDSGTDPFQEILYSAIYDFNKDPQLARCPAVRNQNLNYKIGGLAYAKSMYRKLNTKLHNTSCSPYGYDILFYDPVPDAHGEYWLGILETGKIIQDTKTKWNMSGSVAWTSCGMAVGYWPEDFPSQYMDLLRDQIQQ